LIALRSNPLLIACRSCSEDHRKEAAVQYPAEAVLARHRYVRAAGPQCPYLAIRIVQIGALPFGASENAARSRAANGVQDPPCGGRAFGMPPNEAELREFRSRPLNITPRASLFRVVQEDGRGWLWVLTTSRTAGGTEIDVFDDTEYRGSVTLPDHVLGIQVTRDTLLVLVEVDDPDRLEPMRRLDWYEIVR
jgi:hypothetical protein